MIRRCTGEPVVDSIGISEFGSVQFVHRF